MTQSDTPTQRSTLLRTTLAVSIMTGLTVLVVVNLRATSDEEATAPPARASVAPQPSKQSKPRDADRAAAQPPAAPAAARPAEAVPQSDDDSAETVAEERQDDHESTLRIVSTTLVDLQIPDDVRLEVIELYRETFRAGQAIRDEVSDGSRTPDEARKAHAALRTKARGELEALLEPDELDALRKNIRQQGRGSL